MDAFFFDSPAPIPAPALRIGGGMRALPLLFAAPAALLLWRASGVHTAEQRAATARPADGPAAAAGAPAQDEPTRTPTSPPESAAAEPPNDPVFVATVRPILRSHCAPCHEPGGKMYDRLPFDHSGVVASHSAGVLRRIPAADEKAAIERWLAGQP
jgi:hypothetical protein